MNTAKKQITEVDISNAIDHVTMQGSVSKGIVIYLIRLLVIFHELKNMKEISINMKSECRMSDIKLKPCPFCGGVAEFVLGEQYR